MKAVLDPLISKRGGGNDQRALAWADVLLVPLPLRSEESQRSAPGFRRVQDPQMAGAEDRVVLSLSDKLKRKGTLQAGTRREIVGIAVSVLCRNRRQKAVCRGSVGISTGVVNEVGVDISDDKVLRRTWRFPRTVESRKQRRVIRSVFSANRAIRGKAPVLGQLPIIRR